MVSLQVEHYKVLLISSHFIAIPWWRTGWLLDQLKALLGLGLSLAKCNHL
jgi:hypothetical protein